ncbi:hypothetical protein EMIHUDRAFT_109334 [Emiliania huxleyi CCMP1516]|uniref:Uncharacterized protein n=2 Tax=Emiliania huxleyi TaxID=2903 RepID=A0A0D3KRP0_EMIH1|nr:hypothetical protein EMIHUDRAFT_109334 [Emiliania huxleyi CCMP1516]EOD38425.1 hypothetical protein EMIHUDRAFT_109334 [Emiliania huxleyi CCMP1516]|eukprot:XP_005790854.1 hypothetical protein EMIHUDRAFT_109334 [Emiliania huxleyi CCMP1516]
MSAQRGTSTAERLAALLALLALAVTFSTFNAASFGSLHFGAEMAHGPTLGDSRPRELVAERFVLQQLARAFVQEPWLLPASSATRTARPPPEGGWPFPVADEAEAAAGRAWLEAQGGGSWGGDSFATGGGAWAGGGVDGGGEGGGADLWAGDGGGAWVEDGGVGGGPEGGEAAAAEEEAEAEAEAEEEEEEEEGRGELVAGVGVQVAVEYVGSRPPLEAGGGGGRYLTLCETDWVCAAAWDAAGPDARFELLPALPPDGTPPRAENGSRAAPPAAGGGGGESGTNGTALGGTALGGGGWFALRSVSNGTPPQAAPRREAVPHPVPHPPREPAARSGPALLVLPSELWRTGPRRLRNRGSGGALLNFRGLSDGISVRAHGDEDSAGGSEAACRRASPRTRFELRRIASPPPPPPPPRTASTLPQPAPVTAASAVPLPTPQHAALDSPPLNSSLGP